MRRIPERIPIAAAIACAALPAGAGSLATSSAAGGSSASSAASTASDSSGASSDSSSRTGHAQAEGPYRIVEVAPLAGRPDLVRLTLQAAARDGTTFRVDLPREALDRAGLALGDTVAARRRPYGLELAAAATDRAFFLLLSDDWTHELRSNAVVL